MLRPLRYIVEILAALVGVAAICALLLAWRISSSPVSSDFLAPYLKTGIESLIPGSKADLESILLTWSGSESALVLRARNVKISDSQEHKIADIPTFDTKISVMGLVFGQLTPKELVIDHPRIKLDRNKDGLLIFGGVVVNGMFSDKPAPKPSGGIVQRIAEHLSYAVFTHKLAVTSAVFDVADEKTQKNWLISVPEISVKRNGISDFNRALKYGALDGQITVEVPQAETSTSLNIHYIYDPTVQQHILTLVFNNMIPSLIAGTSAGFSGLEAAVPVEVPLTGKAELIFDGSLTLIKVSAQIHGDEGKLSSPDLWDNPCPVKSLDIDAHYNRVTRKLTVSAAHIDFNGPTLDLKIDGTPSSKQGQDLDFSADVKIDNLPMNRYGEIWPKTVLPNPRYWLTSNLHEGTFDHAEVTLKGSAAFNTLAGLLIEEGSGKIQASGGLVTYIEGMPPVENVGASATFDLKKMDVQITGGGIGNIRLSPFTLQIEGLSEIDQIITIPMQVSGPLPEILRLVDHPPLGYMKALGMSPDDLDGKIEGTLNFRFPLLKSLEVKDIALDATAKATEVASTKLIPGIPINQGNLAMTLDTAGLNLKGRVALGKAPFQIVWQESFEQKPGTPLRHVTAKGSVRDNQWNDMGITFFKGTQGNIDALFEMTKPTKNKTLFSGALNMTAAAVKVDMLNWKKPAKTRAILAFSAEALSDKPVVISPLTLEGEHLSAKGTAILSADMSRLLSLDFSPFILGRTDANIKFTQDFGKNGALHFEATGKSLDVSGLNSGGDSDLKSPPLKKYILEVDRLYTAENGQIDKVKGLASRDKSGWKEISLQGLADGDMPLSIILTPKADGIRTFKLACDNFGKMMKGLGFTETIKRGKITVTGQSTIESPEIIKGTAKISNFTVEKLPVLALLLNATSPFGFSGLVTDSADFDRFGGEFIWHGDEITITRAHAAGTSIGINIDGKVDADSGNANLQGTLVPFGTVNKVLNAIPLIGDLLTGGKDQGVLAVSYKINGKLNAPKVSVNPVSLLTPGFIRNLFFRDNDEDDNADEDTEEEPEEKQ
ncbi:MAG: AsmA-like C-terminal domain-containing protein [Bdellovibrionales bacterium]